MFAGIGWCHIGNYCLHVPGDAPLLGLIRVIPKSRRHSCVCISVWELVASSCVAGRTTHEHARTLSRTVLQTDSILMPVCVCVTRVCGVALGRRGLPLAECKGHCAPTQYSKYTTIVQRACHIPMHTLPEYSTRARVYSPRIAAVWHSPVSSQHCGRTPHAHCTPHAA